MKKKLVLASNNKGKIREFGQMLPNYEVVSLKEMGLNVDVEEDGETFFENALKKAKTISEMLDGALVVADDSGLCVEYLNGYPGVRTARICQGTDHEKNEYLLEMMSGITEVENRKVKHVCVLVAVEGGKRESVEGCLEGTLAFEAKGENGFGFDEIFELPNGDTLAELTSQEKNEISARKKAIESLKVMLEKDFK